MNIISSSNPSTTEAQYKEYDRLLFMQPEEVGLPPADEISLPDLKPLVPPDHPEEIKVIKMLLQQGKDEEALGKASRLFEECRDPDGFWPIARHYFETGFTFGASLIMSKVNYWDIQGMTGFYCEEMHRIMEIFLKNGDIGQALQFNAEQRDENRKIYIERRAKRTIIDLYRQGNFQEAIRYGRCFNEYLHNVRLERFYSAFFQQCQNPEKFLSEMTAIERVLNKRVGYSWLSLYVGNQNSDDEEFVRLARAGKYLIYHGEPVAEVMQQGSMHCHVRSGKGDQLDALYKIWLQADEKRQDVLKSFGEKHKMKMLTLIEGDYRFPYDLVKEIYSYCVAKDFVDEDIAKECFKDEEAVANQKAAEKPKPNTPPAQDGPSDKHRSESSFSCTVS